MLLTLAVPWTDPETHISYQPNDNVEVTDVPTAKNLLRDGYARHAAEGAKPTDPSRRSLVADERDDSAGAGDGQPALKPPPKGGPGSGQDEWAAYAQALGVHVKADAGRDDIIDALREAGHPVD